MKAAILRGKPGIQIKVDKKTNKGGITVTAGDGVLVWSLKLQGTVSKVDLSPLDARAGHSHAGGGARRRRGRSGGGVRWAEETQNPRGGKRRRSSLLLSWRKRRRMASRRQLPP